MINHNISPSGGLLVLSGLSLLISAYALDPDVPIVTLQKIACVGCMASGCAIIAAGLLQMWWER